MITSLVTLDPPTEETTIAQHSHKLLSIFGRWQTPVLSHFSAKIDVKCKTKGFFYEESKGKKFFPTWFFSGCKNNYDRQLLTSRTYVPHLGHIAKKQWKLKINQYICQAWSIETILRQSSIKDKTGSMGTGVISRKEKDVETSFTQRHRLQLLLAPP